MVFRITDYGAAVNDKLQTKAIQSAVDACFLAGGGKVVIPAGVYRTGGIRLRSNVTLYLCSGAYLEGSADPEDYMAYLQDELEPVNVDSKKYKDDSTNPVSRWSNALIKAINAENIAVIGETGSFLDGVNCYDCQGEEEYRGPHLINFHDCRNVHLEGYTMRRSANWAHAIFRSSDITVKNITVYGGHDGFDIFACDRVLVEDSRFVTGDDAIAGFDNQNVVVRNCYFESACSVFRFGGKDVLIQRCRSVAPAGFGHRLNMTMQQKQLGIETTDACRHNTGNVFLYYCDHRLDVQHVPGNILITDCEFIGADALFQMDFGPHMCWCCNRPLTSIRFENCRCLDVSAPSLISGGADMPICFELENVEFTAREGCQDMALADCANFEKVSMKNMKLAGFTDPRVILRSSGAAELDGQIRITESEEGFHYTVI